jgi:hypothetical protein
MKYEFHSAALQEYAEAVQFFTQHNKHQDFIDIIENSIFRIVGAPERWPIVVGDDRMDTEFPLVREAHDRNNEILERIYIGRRFKNDTERLEKLFELYTKMTAQQSPPKKSSNRKPKGSK